MPHIVEVNAEPLDIELREPFGIASGAQLRARNVLVTIRLHDGTTGLGEAAPFPAVSGETQSSSIAAIDAARPLLVGSDGTRWRRIGALLREIIGDQPAARAALECALLDALGRRAGLSLWTFFGGAEAELTTDITIPTGAIEHARESARRAAARGFRTLKIKVGAEPAFDAERVRAIAEAAPECRLVLDANASLTAEQALELLAELGPERSRIALFEQPTAADDLDGLRRVEEVGRLPVAADESAHSAARVAELIRMRAASVINVKIMKTGVCEALDMIATARASGLGLMIGGMVEAEIAMTTSACIAAGIGGFAFVDLDTPLFLERSPFAPGIWDGARLALDGIERGHGLTR